MNSFGLRLKCGIFQFSLKFHVYLVQRFFHPCIYYSFLTKFFSRTTYTSHPLLSSWILGIERLPSLMFFIFLSSLTFLLPLFYWKSLPFSNIPNFTESHKIRFTDFFRGRSVWVWMYLRPLKNFVYILYINIYTYMYMSLYMCICDNHPYVESSRGHLPSNL